MKSTLRIGLIFYHTSDRYTYVFTVLEIEEKDGYGDRKVRLLDLVANRTINSYFTEEEMKDMLDICPPVMLELLDIKGRYDDASFIHG